MYLSEVVQSITFFDLRVRDIINIVMTIALASATWATWRATSKQAQITGRLAEIEHARDRRALKLILSGIHYKKKMHEDSDVARILVTNPTGNDCVVTGASIRYWDKPGKPEMYSMPYMGVLVAASIDMPAYCELFDGTRLALVENLSVKAGESQAIFVPFLASDVCTHTGLMVQLHGPHLDESQEWWYIAHPRLDEYISNSELKGEKMPLEYSLLREMITDMQRRLGAPFSFGEDEQRFTSEQLRNWKPEAVRHE